MQLGPIAKDVKIRRCRAKRSFDVDAFLAHIGQGRKIVRVRKKSRVYAQGDACDAVFHIRKGKIKLTVVRSARKP